MKVGDLYKVVPVATNSGTSRDPSQLGDLVVIADTDAGSIIYGTSGRIQKSPTVIAINLLTGQKRYYSSNELQEVMSEGRG